MMTQTATDTRIVGRLSWIIVPAWMLFQKLSSVVANFSRVVPLPSLTLSTPCN